MQHSTKEGLTTKFTKFRIFLIENFLRPLRLNISFFVNFVSFVLSLLLSLTLFGCDSTASALRLASENGRCGAAEVLAVVHCTHPG